MKSAKVRLLVNLAAIAVIGLAVSNVPLQAQSVSLVINVPFAFHVGDTTLPEGTYTVTRQGDAIRIWDGNGHAASVISNAIANPTKGTANELAFNRYGGGFFLSEVRWDGYSNARGLLKSRTELEYAKASPREEVKLAALTR